MGYRRVTLGASKLGQFPERNGPLCVAWFETGNFKEMPFVSKSDDRIAKVSRM
jgi:hypothetical protein